MFRLTNGEYNNSNIYDRIKTNQEVALKHYAPFDLDYAQALVTEHLTEKAYQSIVGLLTLGEEILGIDKRQADMLYFILVVNHKNMLGEYPQRIDTLSQGRILYNACNGKVSNFINQFQQYDKEPTYMTIKAMHRQLFDEHEITYRIPIFFYKADGEKRVTLMHPTCLFAKVESDFFQTTSVPRVVYLKFLKELPKVVTKTDDIRRYFDESDNYALTTLFDYIGIEKVDVIPLSSNFKYRMKENRLFMIAYQDEEIEHENIRQMDYRTYYYVEKGIVPLFRSKDIIIYRGQL